MNTVRGKYRFACVLGLAVAFALATADANRAHARSGGGFGGVDPRGAAIIGLVALAVAVIVVGGAIHLVKKAADQERRAAVPIDAGPVGEKESSAAPNQFSGEAQRSYLAMPRCQAVGGYEAYRKRTGELCRLY